LKIYAIAIRVLLGVSVVAGCALFAVGQSFAQEVTVDAFQYRYEETRDEGGFMMHDFSDPPFVSVGLRDWRAPETVGDFGLMYTTEVGGGKTDYRGRNAGVQTKTYYRARGEVYLAYRMTEIVTPFAGLGYRFIHDDSGGSHTENGGTAYDRQNHLFYIPMGLQFDPTEKLSFKLQANFVLRGLQYSYLTDTDPSYENAINKQDKGYGFDITGVYKFTPSWSTYGFYRF
tara:strand:- start:2451 stop:3137 length:687 start_codon:yes stop_codon:yes gene_type:complete